MIEEVIVDEKVLCAAFFARFLHLSAASRLTKVAHEGGARRWRWHGNPVWRQGDMGWK